MSPQRQAPLPAPQLGFDLEAPRPKLSKSKFVDGWQCVKLLWWKVHDPHADELKVDVVLRDLWDQGHDVELRARQEFPAETGVQFAKRFEADGVVCIADVVGQGLEGPAIVEVKQTTRVKDKHIPDAAIQMYTARKAGLDVRRVEIMHLNREFRAPADGVLFIREDVTARAEAMQGDLPRMIAEQTAALAGPLPDHPVGEHCWNEDGDQCPFFARCWPHGDDHISNLWKFGRKKTLDWMAKGVHTIEQLPADARLNAGQKRQIRAQRERRMIVEPTLREALKPALEARRLGFLDFETINRALPVWNGQRPYDQIAAQYSYHEKLQGDSGTGGQNYRHADFLAEGPEDPNNPPSDPRERLAEKMLADTNDADLIVVYHKAFEATRIKELGAQLPRLAEQLSALGEKLWDLEPVVTDHVYHPAFGGSFSLKCVLPALVPGMSYDDLVQIKDGKTASVEIARLLFVSGKIPKEDREFTRRNLLAYCRQDTFATVRLVEQLDELSRIRLV